MNNKISRVSLTARVVPTLKKALETESREHGQTTSNYVETILLKRGEAVSDDGPVSTDMQQQLELLRAKNEKLEAQLETYVPEDTLQQEQENAVYREQQYQTRIEELTAHIEQLSTTSSEHAISHEEYDLLALEKSSLVSEKETLQARIGTLKEQLQSAQQYNEKNDKLRTRFLQLQETERFLRINNDGLKEQVRKLTEEVETTENAFEEITETNQELADIYEAKIEKISNELNAFRDIGFDVQELKLVEEENDELHDRVETLEVQLIEQNQTHETALLELQNTIEALEEADTIDPDYVSELQDTIGGHTEHISNLEEELAEFEGKMMLDLTPKEVDEMQGHLAKLQEIHDGRTDEELVLAALYCGVKNERAFFRVLVGDYFKAQ